MIQELQLRILPQEGINEQALKVVVARETGHAMSHIQAVRVLKRSIDARQRTIYINVKLRAFIDEEPTESEYQSVDYKDVSDSQSVVVVGAGPGAVRGDDGVVEAGGVTVRLSSAARGEQDEGARCACSGESKSCAHGEHHPL